jgi:hypothetical protein
MMTANWLCLRLLFAKRILPNAGQLLGVDKVCIHTKRWGTSEYR